VEQAWLADNLLVLERVMQVQLQLRQILISENQI
jgi:hypothetical protein